MPAPLRFNRCLMLAGCVSLCVSMVAIGGNQILEIHSSTLTNYLAGSTNLQGLRPNHEHRGVNIDGSARLLAQMPIALAGDPTGGDGWNRHQTFGGIRLDTGQYPITAVDLDLPAPLPFQVMRSFNNRQQAVSAGPMGNNWAYMPEIVLHDDDSDPETDETEDVLYLVYGADRFVAYDRHADDSDLFKGKNGAAGVFKFSAGATDEPDTYTLYDQAGNQIVFFGFNADADPVEGQFWKMIDPDDNKIYGGDATTGSTAISNGYTARGFIDKLYQVLDGGDTRRYDYDYNGSNKLTTITVAVDDGGGYADTGDTVDYTYYGASDSHGVEHDLKTVTVTVPLTDSSVEVEMVTYYRYSDDTDSELKMIVGPEGTRNYGSGYATATDTALKPYADAFFTYVAGSAAKIDTAWFNGACGCSGGIDGELDLDYETNGTDDNGYDADEQRQRVIVEKPDTTYLTVYFDETGQATLRVLTLAHPSVTSGQQKYWIWEGDRGATGLVETLLNPDTFDSYEHTNWDAKRLGADFIPPDPVEGRRGTFDRVTSGNLTGFLTAQKFKIDDGNEKYVSSRTFDERVLELGAVDVVRPLQATQRSYHTATTTLDDSSASVVTDFDYAYWSETSTNVEYIVIKRIEVTHPTVSGSNNGSNAATYSRQFLRKDGTTAFSEIGSDTAFSSSPTDGIYTYTQHTNGQVVKRIQDAKTNSSTDFASGDDPNGTWGITESGDGTAWETLFAYDDQGRSTTVTLPDGRIQLTYYSTLGDGRLVSTSYNDYDSSTPKFWGPVGYSVANHAGQIEVHGVIALSSNETTTALTGHIDETDSDPITAVDVGTLSSMSTNIFDDSGVRLEESRRYFDIPTSGTGTASANYDPTTYIYSDSGDLIRTADPTGTIFRSDFDLHRRVTDQYLGTDDTGDDGSPMSGSNNMTKIVSLVYDDGNDMSNGLLTDRTDYVQGSTTDERVTTYEYDGRGRLIVRNNPTAPHVLNKYDNQGRSIAVGLYASTTGLDPSDDPVTLSTNRMALGQTEYDEMGRPWKMKWHKIDDADGSDDDNITSENWYHKRGFVMKTDGRQLTKTFQDRLGRVTHQFILAVDDDTTYAHADDVSGDIVLEESQTSYDPDTGYTWMTANIQREQDDAGGSETTGALDTNADGDDDKFTATNLAGRIQISASWFEAHTGRLSDTVQYGTYGGSDFDRSDSGFDDPPTRSDTALRTTNVYNDDGTLLSVTDPEDLETRYEYDDAAQRTLVISNYVNGTPSGDNNDDDIHVRYDYTDGLQTRMHVDFDGDDAVDSIDQVTTWTFGVVDGTKGSLVDSGRLLYKVVYPEASASQAEADRTVFYGYNAQGEQVYLEDQDDNVIETEFDDSGRELHRKATTIGGSFDNTVQRISTTYDSLGRVSTVGQYDDDDPASGSIIDEVKYTYEDWGNISKVEQDHDSAVGGTLLYDVDFAYEKNTDGRNTIRRTTFDLPDGNQITFTYDSATTSHDDDASRVTEVKDGAVILADYGYLGADTVIGIEYPEPDLFGVRYDPADTDDYRDLDRFNRVTRDRWYRDLSTDLYFFDHQVSWDRNSNVTLVQDEVFNSGVSADMDTEFTMDDLNRLTRAQWGTYTTSITSEWRDTNWTLDQVGNWEDVFLDLDADDTYDSGTGEYDDDRVHEQANNITTRDVDDDETIDYTLTYNKRGDITDDAEHFEYVWDAFGRLKKVKNQSSTLVAEYTYNGLNHLIIRHEDTDDDGDADGNDTEFRHVYDDQWRIVATYRESDADPKEQFVFHNAGADGFGGSSYIDTVIMRDKDANTAWTSAADGTLEDRVYYIQNWRADVVALVDSSHFLREWVRYDAYGTPYGMPQTDTNGDGTVNTTDLTNILAAWGSNSYPTGDHNLDGTIDVTDLLAQMSNSGNTLGWGALSLSGAKSMNRKGYAGYEHLESLSGGYTMWHVRYRVLNSELGRWLSRDPLGYVDTANLLAYVMNNPLPFTDPSGQLAQIFAGCVVGGLLGGIGGGIGGFFGGGLDWKAAKCGALGGAISGCCLGAICSGTFGAGCTVAGCLCALVGEIVNQICMGNDLSICTFLSLLLVGATGCAAGGVLADDDILKIAAFLLGLDAAAVANICSGFQEVFEPRVISCVARPGRVTCAAIG